MDQGGSRAAGSLADFAPVDAGSRADEPLGASDRRSFDAILGGSIFVLALLTVVTLVPGARFAVANGTLDVILNTLTAVAAAGATALAWIRYRIEREVAAIYESAAFLVLCITRAVIVALAAFGSPTELGMSLDAPQQWPLYAWSIARLLSAALLVLAAASTLRRVRSVPAPTLLLEVGPLIALLVTFVALRTAEPNLPPLLGDAGLAALRGDAGAQPGMAPLGLLFQAVIALIYFAGALLYRQLLRESGRRYAGYLAIALIVAGVSQLHWATYPGIYRPLVTVDDLLRATFSIILLLGIEAQFRADVRALRTANANLRALRADDVERAGLEASARLAREVHDGLSQDLWLAKLRHAALAAQPGLPEAALPLVTELGDAVDRALVDARSVVASLRSEQAVIGLGDAIQRTVGDFERTTGIRTQLTIAGTLPVVDSAAGREVIRVVREALTNVRKHADATNVLVSVRAANDRLEVEIADNGRGFNAASAGDETFGIKGMRERSRLLGGSLQIVSEPADGTRVRLSMPLQGAASPSPS
jgi:signal transduction histidine kinase